MFRQVIEDAHSKYHISDEDIKVMCKDAVNHAAAFLDIANNPDMYRGFLIYAINGIHWDDAEVTDHLEMEMKELEAWGKGLDKIVFWMIQTPHGAIKSYRFSLAYPPCNDDIPNQHAK